MPKAATATHWGTRETLESAVCEDDSRTTTAKRTGPVASIVVPKTSALKLTGCAAPEHWPCLALHCHWWGWRTFSFTVAVCDVLMLGFVRLLCVSLCLCFMEKHSLDSFRVYHSALLGLAGLGSVLTDCEPLGLFVIAFSVSLSLSFFFLFACRIAACYAKNWKIALIA